ncbi:hypothetical protein KJ742_07425 [Patescibacteria group bacterium]|nr:hypothetical protein [Patescibacteria group bacterium]MBU1683741.1 hypothetical protein [Patescibacteria group bacterium]MBU1934531.1 hypothetical protein [Patescibacteria group bacterium]
MGTESTQGIDDLVTLVSRIPTQAKKEIIQDLSRDGKLNPNGVAPEEIARRLADIDSQDLLAAVGRERLGALIQLSKDSGAAEARGAWLEQPSRKSMMGKVAMELRAAAKEIITTLAQLDKDQV